MDEDVLQVVKKTAEEQRKYFLSLLSQHSPFLLPFPSFSPSFTTFEFLMNREKGYGEKVQAFYDDWHKSKKKKLKPKLKT